MPALGTTVSICLLLIALSTAACSDGSGPEDVGRAVETLGAGAAGTADWRLVWTSDFNRDGLRDVLWSDRRTNRLTVWLMSGTAVLAKGPEIPGPRADGWAAKAAGDFNRDGMADVLWHNATTNRMIIWLMNGTAVLEKGPEIPAPSGVGWTAVKTGDFNRDGVVDLLWYNPTTNHIAIWLLAGTQVLEQGPEIAGPLGDGWNAVDVADFDRDGLADVLWNNPTTNHMAVWLLAGTEVREQGPEIAGPLGDGWKAARPADFNFDGMADVLWHNATTDRITVWLMSSTGLVAPGPEIPGPSGDGWRIASVNDENGDGMTDVFWLRSPLNIMTVWLMNGTRVLARGPLIPGPL
ncbi:MAG: VCBS repeat-containing protein [Minicystis sp.]